MGKTYYISMDSGKTFKRFTKNKEQFAYYMWITLTRELYPLTEWSLRDETLEIAILEPKCMRQIYKHQLQNNISLDDLWHLIRAMWNVIEQQC